MAEYIQLASGMVVPVSFAGATTQPASREIATTRDGRDITRGYVSPFQLLAPQDTVLAARGAGNYAIYREVLRDDQVAANFGQRRLAVVAKAWEVEPATKTAKDKAAADFLREQLAALMWDSATDKMLFGVFYGYAVAEMLWGRDGRFVTIDQIQVRDRRRFGFDGEMRLRLLTMGNANPGELVPERKFWSFATGADHDDEPYGLGLAHWLYWPALFKRGGVKFWLIFLEKFGQPTAKGSYPGSATAEEKSRLLAALAAITTDAGVILPEGMAIELIEAARSGTADYTALYDRMNAAIAKVILGHTGSSDATPGRLGGEDNAHDVRQDLVKADADLVCQSFNRGPAAWLTEWNFPGARPPRVWRQVDEGEDLDMRSQVDERLHAMGYEPESVEYINETYGGTWRKKAVSPPSLSSPPGRGAGGEGEQPGAQFAEGDPDPTPVTAMSDRLAEAAAPAWEAILAEIHARVATAESLEALRDDLIAAFGERPPAELASIMEIAFAAADLAGRYDAQQRQ